MWITYRDGRLCRMNLHTRQYSVITRDTTTGQVLDLITDGHDNLWAGTAKGLCQFDPAIGRFLLRWKSRFTSGHHSMVSSLCTDSQQNIWGVTFGGELVRYTPNGHAARVFMYQLPNGQSPQYMLTYLARVQVGSTEYMAVSSYDGLVLFNPDTKSFDFQRNEPGNPESLPTNGLSALYVDQTGILWLGSD